MAQHRPRVRRPPRRGSEQRPRDTQRRRRRVRVRRIHQHAPSIIPVAEPWPMPARIEARGQRVRHPPHDVVERRREGPPRHPRRQRRRGQHFEHEHMVFARLLAVEPVRMGLRRRLLDQPAAGPLRPLRQLRKPRKHRRRRREPRHLRNQMVVRGRPPAEQRANIDLMLMQLPQERIVLLEQLIDPLPIRKRRPKSTTTTAAATRPRCRSSNVLPAGTGSRPTMTANAALPAPRIAPPP